MSTERVALPLLRLDCGGSYVVHLEQAILRLDGVRGATINPLTEMAYVEYDPRRLSPDTLLALIAEEGFGGDTERARVVAPRNKPVAMWNLSLESVGPVVLIWFCTLPLLVLLFVPLFGIYRGAALSAALPAAALVCVWLHRELVIRGSSDAPQPSLREGE